MDFLMQFVDVILHVDVYLGDIINQFGAWSYLVIFAIIFCETGLIVAPFLPGDSLLFASGAFAAKGYFDIVWLYLTITGAAILGDMVNYRVGRWFGPRAFQSEKSRFLNKAYLERTHNFYQKYGGKTIILARFIPIVRTFAPFVAGVGAMSYWQFAVYNVAGAFIWAAVFALGGYFFGNLDIIKNNFSAFILLIIVVSFLPGVASFFKHKISRR